MGNLKFLNSILFVLLLAGCKPHEPKIELGLNKQPVEQAFSFADYCEEKYDSIYIINPYDDEEKIWALPYKMSRKLRSECSYTTNDAYLRVLFIKNGTIEAYSEIPSIDASFSTKSIEKNGPLHPFNQKFIMNKDRRASLYPKSH